MPIQQLFGNGRTKTARPRRPVAGGTNAHVIVIGNEKGGSGKTTTSMHLAVALLKAGYTVATFDLDPRQQSLARYIANRSRWSRAHQLTLELPTHVHLELAAGDSARQTQAADLETFLTRLDGVQRSHDFIVVDTPGAENYLMRLAHSMADTLITPMNDSFVDFDVLGRIDPHLFEVTTISHYAETVRDARRQRRVVDNGLLDWVVVRNRLSTLASRNQQNLLSCVRKLSMQLGFRIADGISERVIFREYFPMGLTALDDLQSSGLGDDARLTRSHLAARQEIESLLASLRLPDGKDGDRRLRSPRLWQEPRANAPSRQPANAN